MTKIGVANSNISIREVAEKKVYSITESQEFIKALDRMPDELIYKKVPLKFLILTGVKISEPATMPRLRCLRDWVTRFNKDYPQPKDRQDNRVTLYEIKVGNKVFPRQHVVY